MCFVSGPKRAKQMVAMNQVSVSSDDWSKTCEGWASANMPFEVQHSPGSIETDFFDYLCERYNFKATRIQASVFFFPVENPARSSNPGTTNRSGSPQTFSPKALFR